MTEQNNEMQLNTGKAAIAKKITLISHEIGKVKAEGHNSMGQGYNFIGYEQVNAILRTMLVKHGIAIIPEFNSSQERDFTAKDKFCIRTIVQGTAEIIDTETGASIIKNICGADQDYGGKSFGQACTEAVKRFELKLFHISTKGDIDPDSKTSVIPTPTTNTTPAKISAIQRKELFALAETKNYPNEVIAEYLDKKYKIKSSANITNEQLVKITKDISEETIEDRIQEYDNANQ